MEEILIIDDDLDSLKLIGLMLQRHGYHVAAANSGTQGLAKIRQHRPDLVMSDVMMPDMDGYYLCRKLRDDPDFHTIPILMFTAKTLDEDRQNGYDAGADDYLTKPTHPSELASRIKSLLASIGEPYGAHLRRWIAMRSEFLNYQVGDLISPSLYTQLYEATAVMSHVLHDATNALGILNERLSYFDINPNNTKPLFRMHLLLLYANVLMGNLSELRLSSRWEPSNISLNVIMQLSIDILAEIAPRTKFQLDSPIEQGIEIFGDFNQMLQLMTILMMEMATDARQVSVKLSLEDIGASIVWKDLEKFPKIPSVKALKRGKVQSDQFITWKLLFRHGITHNRLKNEFVLHFPNILPANERLLGEKNRLEEQIERQRQSSELRKAAISLELRPNIAPLISNNVNLLITGLDNITKIILDLAQEEFSKAPYKIMLRSIRFAKLVFSNLLIVAEGSHPHLTRVNINSAIDDVLVLLENKIPEEVKIIVNYGDNLVIQADEGMLLQVLLNLCINALEAMGDEGEIRILTVASNKEIKISITDTGKGISHDQLSEIFHLGYSTKKGQQRGIGLHVVKSVMDSLGGTIDVTSQPNQGTVFVLSFKRWFHA